MDRKVWSGSGRDQKDQGYPFLQPLVSAVGCLEHKVASCTTPLGQPTSTLLEVVKLGALSMGPGFWKAGPFKASLLVQLFHRANMSKCPG
mmetsp:Transcript_13972/g.39887  ORF Transcript_13972/g.39887 Transcript_13972/m.39887 type:complete len:90 (-) Transcript_13972:141-410(-)